MDLEQLDFSKVSKSLEHGLQSLDQAVSKADQLDFEGLSTNANGLLLELRDTNKRLQGFIASTQGTVKGLNLEKLSTSAENLLTQVRETIEKVQPGLANFDFNSLNETLVNARRAVQTLDEALRRALRIGTTCRSRRGPQLSEHDLRLRAMTTR